MLLKLEHIIRASLSLSLSLYIYIYIYIYICVCVCVCVRIYIYTYICMYIFVIISICLSAMLYIYIYIYILLPKHSHRQEATQGKFLKRSLAGLNLVCSFSLIGCHTNVKEPNLPDYLLIVGKKIVGCIPCSRVLA